jgi:hypothetical protein
MPIDDALSDLEVELKKEETKSEPKVKKYISNEPKFKNPQTKAFIEALIDATEKTFNDPKVLRDSDRSYRQVCTRYK